MTEPESVWFIVQRTPVGDLPAIVHDPKKGKPSDWGVIYSLRIDDSPGLWNVPEHWMEWWRAGKLPGQRGKHNAG